ncbi:MAG: YdeI/OmpD-associated family protein [Myxococcales bacterium]|nr:YdeI/OmpD-associated family protein [Myxococcales bacterium]MCB9582452.1 YdeI/OmpD-associated family protein [Polyangiaceae bacterium]
MAKLPDDLPIRSFPSATAFGRWLAREHRKSPGMWLKIPKKDRGKAGPTYREALEEALRFGWIDSQKAKLDDDFYLQRFTPRGPQSRWSKINRKNVEALIAAGRMMPAGMKEVDAAKRDGRWKKAYASQSSAKVPADLKAALDANPKARAFFAELNAQNRFSILYRIQDAKRPETRARRIAKFVEMCARGETLN